MSTSPFSSIPGHLVTLPLPGKNADRLDGFLVKGQKKGRRLLIFVHGMGSNFYRSEMKKSWMRLAPDRGVDVLTFNNRGCEGQVADERFKDCIADLDSALALAQAANYREITLLGHSTGCQKITYYWTRRRPPAVTGLILAALGDDHAIARRDLGSSFNRWVNRAKALVAAGKGDERLPPRCLSFSARRFLSAVEPGQLESELFRLDGPMRVFRKVTLPVLAVFPEKEQYACIPVAEAAARLRAASRSSQFAEAIIPDADHSFHGHEDACTRVGLDWITRK